MDLSTTIAPKSDQVDAVDLASGPRTVTITGIREGNPEQPVQIDLAEFDRPWRPSKSMRRVLVAAWGADGQAYVGRRLTLYCDPTVMFGGIAVGGTRISHMSDIKTPLDVVLLLSRGKSAIFHVDPLRAPAKPAPVPVVTPERVAAASSEAELKSLWRQTQDLHARAAIQQCVAELRAQVTPLPDTDTDPETAA